MLKMIDVVAAVLLVMGGLNWGMVGVFNFNLVSTMFSNPMMQNMIYALVGMAAIYQVFTWKAIQQRWGH